VRIDPADAQSALDLARAALDKAEADLRDAERNLTLAQDDVTAAEDQAALREKALSRQRDLLERGVGTEPAVETAELAAAAARQAVLSRRQALAQAETRIDQSRNTLQREGIALAEAERRLADTEIFAQFSGVLSDVSVVEGGLVSPNERIAQIVDPDALEVSFRVSTSQYARLLDETGRLVGLPVTVSLDVMGADIVTQGAISRESAAVGEGQTGRLIFARLDEAAGFRPGDFVTVTVEEDPLEGVALLPATAVDPAGRVLVVGEDERLSEEPVELLRRQGDDVIVRAAVLEGRDVVAERTPLLGGGIKVRPIRPPQPGESAASEPAEPELVQLDPERRARLVAFIEGNQFMPADAKERVLAQLKQDRVPAQMIERIESRMGG
jgi:RND family efflux transporter MFP subunit